MNILTFHTMRRIVKHPKVPKITVLELQTLAESCGCQVLKSPSLKVT